MADTKELTPDFSFDVSLEPAKDTEKVENANLETNDEKSVDEIKYEPKQKLTPEQKAQIKKQLAERRNICKNKINELKKTKSNLVLEYKNLCVSLKNSQLPLLQTKLDNLMTTINSVNHSSPKKELEQELIRLKRLLRHPKIFIKQLPEVKTLKEKISDLKDQINLNRKLIKDKNPELQAFKHDFDSNHIFEVSNLNLWYNNGHKHALKNININLLKNKVTAFIGPSGCGKSTFLRTLNRMNDVIEGVKITGNVWFSGKNISSKILSELELRTRVGMVFQKPTPFNLSIYENIAYALKSHGIKDRAIIDKIVKESLMGAALWDEVKDILNESALGLSGGQQQRLCIARAIALHPDVLLMDEPTSALDPIATNKVEILINELRKKFSIVIVTHSMAQAQRISDNTVFFYEGEIIESGPTKAIFTQPKQKRTKDYVSGRIG